jgi:hypothetical protein
MLGENAEVSADENAVKNGSRRGIEGGKLTATG